MDSEYLSRLKNDSIQAKLLNVEHISTLEHLLEVSSTKLNRLQDLKDKKQLDFGKIVSPKDVAAVSLQVFNDVNSFLNISPNDFSKDSLFQFPECSYFPRNSNLNIIRSVLLGAHAPMLFVSAASMYAAVELASSSSLDVAAVAAFAFISAVSATGLKLINDMYKGAHLAHRYSATYYKDSNRIRVGKGYKFETSFKPTLGHEYSHGLHTLFEINDDCYDAFMEGHARGIERHLSEKYSAMENNDAFLYHPLILDVAEYKSVYVWMCEELGKSPKTSLLKTKTFLDSNCEALRRNEGRPGLHGLGNSLISIYECSNDKEMYRDMLLGKFKF